MILHDLFMGLFALRIEGLVGLGLHLAGSRTGQESAQAPGDGRPGLRSGRASDRDEDPHHGGRSQNGDQVAQVLELFLWMPRKTLVRGQNSIQHDRRPLEDA